MHNGNKEETKFIRNQHRSPYEIELQVGEEGQTYLFDSSNIPARAQYHAANAESKLKKPDVLIIGVFGPPLASRCKYPIPSNKNARSRVEKMKKNATVERSVAMRRRVVNMNQP